MVAPGKTVPGVPAVDASDGLPGAVLSWHDVTASASRLLRLSFRITFRRKILFMLGGVLVYYGILYAVSVYEPNAGLSVNDALFALVELPGAVLGIYLTMDLIAKERDRQTLETLFSTASSHYVIWTVRLLSVCAVLLATLLLISALAYVLFAEFPFVGGAFNAFLPAFLFTGATFYFSSLTRGGNTAAMLASGTLILSLMFSDELGPTPYWIFLNPFELPPGGSELFWTEKVVLNRLGVFAAGALLIFLGLRRMEDREKFLS